MQGLISQVLGPVVDVDFKDYLPQINEALTVNFEAEGKKQKLVLEVAAHLGDNRVRTIAMDMTDGLTRGLSVEATGNSITVPVGEKVLGRIFNVVGDLIDEGETRNLKSVGAYTENRLNLKSKARKARFLKRALRWWICLPLMQKVEKSDFLAVRALAKRLSLWSLSTMWRLNTAATLSLRALAKGHARETTFTTK